jgi:hypothetical protein
MPRLPRALVALANGLLEIFAEHGGAPTADANNMRPTRLFSITLSGFSIQDVENR